MSVFSDDRQAIAEALDGAGVNVYDHLPGRAIPPCYIVLHGSPFVSREDTDPFGSATAHYEVWAVAGTGANEVEAASVEDLTWHAMTSLHAEGFEFEQAAQPVSFDLNGTYFLAIQLTVSTTLTLH